MSKSDQHYKPFSLAQYFSPFEDLDSDSSGEYRGCFAWLCGYSADAAFLNDAIERFVGHTKAQREYTGRIAIALMLAPGNPQIRPSEAPGVIHLPILNDKVRPFTLLHAK